MTSEAAVNTSVRSLLISSVMVVPLALVAGATGPAAAEPPSTVFGSHVSSCAQSKTGFTGQHNPSHHRVPAASHDMHDMHC